MIRKRWGMAILAVVCLALLGCGGSKTPHVTGTIKFKGKPLAGAHVSFWPVEGTGRAASGFTDSNGRFKLGTLSADDGAAPGQYRVSVIARGPDRPLKPGEVGSGMPGEKMPGDPIIPLKYFAPDSSGLTFEVKRGSNRADFELAE